MKQIRLNLFFIFIISLLICTRALGQTVQFQDIYIEPEIVQSGKFKNFEAYDLNDMVLYKKQKKADEILVLDKSTDVEIYSFSKTLPGTSFSKPKFFASDDISKPIIMLLDVSDIYSFGIHVFLIKDSSLYYCGFLKYAADNFNFSSLALYSHFISEGEKIIYTLDDINIIDHVNEKLIKGSNLKFEIVDDKIQPLTNQK